MIFPTISNDGIVHSPQDPDGAPRVEIRIEKCWIRDRIP